MSLLLYIHKEDHDSTNYNAITMYQEIGIINLHLIDYHTIRAPKVANIGTIRARKYFCMPARSSNVKEYNIACFVPSKRNTPALLQINNLRATLYQNDKRGIFLQGGTNISCERFCR